MWTAAKWKTEQELKHSILSFSIHSPQNKHAIYSLTINITNKEEWEKDKLWKNDYTVAEKKILYLR